MSTQFPSEWVRRKRRDNFHVTVVGTIGSRTAYHWVVVVTSGTNFHQQIVELDFVYPSEAIHLYWDQGELFESFPDARPACLWGSGCHAAFSRCSCRILAWGTRVACVHAICYALGLRLLRLGSHSVGCAANSAYS